MSEQITNALKSSSILYQIFAFVRNKKDRGRRCVIQYYVWSRNCVQLTVLSLCSYSRRNACIQRLSVVSGISWRESRMVMTAAEKGVSRFTAIDCGLDFFQSISLSFQKSKALTQVHTHTVSTGMSHISLLTSSGS